VIAAAGSGERLGAGGPKAFVPLAGRPMVEWSIDAFRAAPSVYSIVVACPPGYPHHLSGRDVHVVDGGATRVESVFNALEAVKTEFVAVHDAARPLVTPELIEGVVSMLAADPDANGAIVAARATDTIKLVEVKRGALVVESTLVRDRLRAAQTPQVFPTVELAGALAEALSGSGEEVTDDAAAVELLASKVLIYEPSVENLKVTTPSDLRLAELLLAERAARTESS
jgi:2-C-methyl-D-erythritol 4-phosphate cytidylyltransferase